MIPDLAAAGRAVVLGSGFLIGVSKTGVPGMGLLAISLMALVIPARSATGVILPMLIFGDVFAVWFYRRKADWAKLVPLVPWTATGIVAGYFLLGMVTDRQLRPAVAAVVLAMLALTEWKGLAQKSIPSRWWFAAALGLLAGVTTMMANAAGPIMIIYLLAMKLPKEEFVGTGAWYFFLLNCFKVPFSANLGLITAETLRLNLFAFPAIACGAVAGLLILRYIPQGLFHRVVQSLTAAAAVRLLFPA